MKAYKVEIEELTSDWGVVVGWRTVGYYTSREKAEKVAAETYKNRDRISNGKTYVYEINIDTED